MKCSKSKVKLSFVPINSDPITSTKEPDIVSILKALKPLIDQLQLPTKQLWRRRPGLPEDYLHKQAIMREQHKMPLLLQRSAWVKASMVLACCPIC